MLAFTCKALGRTEVEGCIAGGLTFAVTTIYFHHLQSRCNLISSLNICTLEFYPFLHNYQVKGVYLFDVVIVVNILFFMVIIKITMIMIKLSALLY